MTTLASIQKKILDVDEMLARLSALSQQSPKPSVFAQIRAFEKEQKLLRSEYDLAAKLEETSVCKYAIDYPKRPTVSGMSAAWGEFQRTFAEVYATFKPPLPPTKKGKAEDPPLQVPEFGWGYEFGGSLGVAMTLPMHDDMLFADPDIDRAVHAVLEIARAKSDLDVEKLSHTFGPKAMAAVHHWADIHAKYGYGIKIDWMPRSGSPESLFLPRTDVSALRDRLGKSTIDTRQEGSGALVAVDIEAHSCRFRMDDGSEIKATFETAITEEHKASLPARYNVAFLVRRPIVGPEGKEPQATHVLLDLTLLGG